MSEKDPAQEEMERHTLLIPLIGPMQSWGSRSRFDDRDTHAEPTKSGVIGLVCSALGVERGDTERLAQLNSLRFGVRVDAPGRAMTDFHTAQAVVKAGGNGTTTVTSRRHYLSDARFLAGLEGADTNFLQTLENALQNPKWTLCLGRKSFPLTVPPILPGGSLRTRQTLEAALKAEPWRKMLPWEDVPSDRNDKNAKKARLRMVIEPSATDAGNDNNALLSDAPLSFDGRRFGLRAARTKMDDFEIYGGDAWSTFHN